MILRTTQKVRDLLGIHLDSAEPVLPEPQFLVEWYVNHIEVDRKKYYVFTEATTLFTDIRSSRGITTPIAFERLATDVLFDIFKFHGRFLDLKIFETIATTVTVHKTNNRRITTSMNELVRFAQLRGNDDRDFDYINGVILGYLDYDKPRERLEKAIEQARIGQYEQRNC